MRVWLSGPRLFGGFIRPGVSFSQAELWPRSRTPASDFVYVITDEHGMSKIGFSSDPRARLAMLQTASAHPLRLMSVIPMGRHAYAVEQEAHAMLDTHRVTGEWFNVSPNVATAAVYGAAERLGVTMDNETKTQSNPFWPKSLLFRFFLGCFYIWLAGNVFVPALKAIGDGIERWLS